jgi:hypothetical protein
MVPHDIVVGLADWSAMVLMLLATLYCGWYLATLPCNVQDIIGRDRRPDHERAQDDQEWREG